MFKTLNLIFILIFCVHNCWSQNFGNAVNLEVLWQIETENPSESPLISTPEGLIVSLIEATGTGFILLDTDSGEILWRIETAGKVVSNPFADNVADNDFLFVPTSLNDKKIIKKFSLKTGIQVGSEAGNTAQTVNASDNVLQFISQNNTVQKNIQNKLSWKTKTGGKINDIQTNKYGVLISSSDNYLYQLNDKNGNKTWKIRFSNKVLGTDLLSDNIGIVSVYADSKVQMFDVQKGKLSGFYLLKENEFPVGKPLVIGDKVFLQTSVGVICLRLKK